MLEKNDFISLQHGSGGRSYHELVERVFVPAFDNDVLRELNDSALCNMVHERIAFTTDSFVVKPLFFPGGDIGRLAVCGTVNDLAMSGAAPRYLSCGMIIEAGFPVDELAKISASMAAAAKEAGVAIVTGDTKVVEKGSCDGIFINTAGVGVLLKAPPVQRLKAGDAIIVSGPIAQHGLAILAARNDLDFTPELMSDAAPLNGLVDVLLKAVPTVHALRDATRGGVAAVLNEWCEASSLSIVVQEDQIPLTNQTKAACELLGIDPLYVANEGKFVAAVPADDADAAVAAMRQHPLGNGAGIIGYADADPIARVSLNTIYGTRRIIDMPDGEQLPRIC